MTDPNNRIDDDYIDPSRLKNNQDENIDPADLIETLKKSDGIRWPGAIFLMFLTLAVGFGLAMLLIFGRDVGAPTADDAVEGPSINQPFDDESITEPSIIVADEQPTQTLPLIGKQLINTNGTFTEWYVRLAETDTKLFPRFVDMTWHPGTERIYLVAHDKRIYWIDSTRTKIEYIDVSLRIGESLPWLEKIEALDQDRLLLQMSNNQKPFVIYNLKTDRVEKRFGEESDFGELGTFDQIQDIGVAPNGTIYIHNRYKNENDEWADQIQVFDHQGTPIHMFPLAERFGDAFDVDADGSIFVMGGFDALFEYDIDGAVLDAIESDNFQHAEDMAFDRDGNLFFVRAFDAWLVEFQPDEQFGQIYGPAHDFNAKSWDLGEVTRPTAFIVMPSGDEFVILDGFDFQRIFLFQPAQ